MNDPTLFKTLELHYYFQDKSHTMDAYVRNKCEAEFLAVIKEIGQILGVRLKVESTPLKEGGLIDFFRFLSENQYFMGVISGISIKVFGDIAMELIKRNPEEDKLRLEKMRIELQIAQKRLNESTPAHTLVNISELAEIVAQQHNVAKHRSEFYRQLNNYHKVTGISYRALNSQGEPVGPRAAVHRDMFDKFISEPDELASVYDSDAEIEIISPVLKRGKNNHKYKWKGIYGKAGKPIDFYMNDEKYEQEIYQSGVSFKTGTSISCVLKIERKRGENGEEIHTGYAVEVVKAKSDAAGTVKTTHGEVYVKTKEAEKRQLGLFEQDL